jgi:hypothetical protein
VRGQCLVLGSLFGPCSACVVAIGWLTSVICRRRLQWKRRKTTRAHHWFVASTSPATTLVCTATLPQFNPPPLPIVVVWRPRPADIVCADWYLVARHSSRVVQLVQSAADAVALVGHFAQHKGIGEWPLQQQKNLPTWRTRASIVESLRVPPILLFCAA